MEIVRRDFCCRVATNPWSSSSPFGADAEAELIGTRKDPASDAVSFHYAASGYPVSSARPGLNGRDALMHVAECLRDGRYDALEEFDGPYVVLVLIPEQKRLVVARDKFGLRCAYWCVEEAGIAVSDNVSRLVGTKGPRLAGLTEWLHYGTALAPLTLFDGIRIIPGGHLLEVGPSGQVDEVRHFGPEDYVSREVFDVNRKTKLAELRDRFEALFEASVARAAHGQAQVSILLSGGVDSSLLTAFARRVTRVSAITIDVHGPGSESERRFATTVAKHLGIEDLRICRFGPEEFVATFCKTVRDLATPLIIENAVALHHAALNGDLPPHQLVMDGEGADALMGGSTSIYKYSMSMRFVSQLVRIGSPKIRRLFDSIRAFLEKFGLSTRSTLDGLGLDVDLGARRMEMVHLTATIGAAFQHLESREDIEIATLMMREFYDYMIPLMLRIDKMSASAGTHTLLPFLSGPVFRFLENLEMRHKLDRSTGSLKILNKGLLKAVLEKQIPRDLVYRPKMGFGIPAWQWVGLPKRWRDDSFVASAFGISKPAFRHWIDVNSGRDKIFLLAIEVWGRLFVWRREFDEVQAEWCEANRLGRAARVSAAGMAA